MTHVGLDKHLQEQHGDKEIVASEHENTNISNKNLGNNEKIPAQTDEKGRLSSTDVSQASHVSPTATADNSNPITVTALRNIRRSIRNYEKMNTLYEQQFDNMQRMNQKWFDVFSKAWEQKQNEKP